MPLNYRHRLGPTAVQQPVAADGPLRGAEPARWADSVTETESEMKTAAETQRRLLVEGLLPLSQVQGWADEHIAASADLPTG